jgi:superfamily II DNA/RNA helicase
MPKRVSEYESIFYDAAAVSSVGDLPEWMRAAIKDNIGEFNALQKEIVPLITAGQPAFCFAPAGAGKSTAAVIGALYRVFVKKDPSQVIIATPTAIMATEIGALCQTLGAGVPDLHVYSLLRDRSVPDAAKVANGRNIFVAPAGIAAMLVDRCGEMISDNTVAVIVLSCEVQLGQVAVRNTFDLFRKVPASIPVTLFASAWNTELEKKAREILPDAATPVIDYRASHKVNHWYSLTAFDMKREVLIKAAKENPFKQGLIFVDKTSEANEINTALNKAGVTAMAVGEAGFKRELSNAISKFQSSEVQYLVIAANAALNSLWRTKAQLVINFNIQSFDQYSTRSSVVSSEGGSPIEMITIISTDRADFFDNLEDVCGVEMTEVSQHLDGGFKPLSTES